MTRDEAVSLLEDLNYCLEHLIPKERDSKSKREFCAECRLAEQDINARKAAQAIAVIRGQSYRPPTGDNWKPCEMPTLPKHGERVLVAVKGFLEPGRAGGKERWTLGGTPLYWKRGN